MPKPKKTAAKKSAHTTKSHAQPSEHEPVGPAPAAAEIGGGQPDQVAAPQRTTPAEDATKSTPANSSPATQSHAPIQIAIDLLDAHPQNPRLGLHEPTVAAQAAQMQARGEFDVAHAITVRTKSDGRYEIIYGHQRTESARRAGLAHVWAFVVAMDDDEARLALATGNMQEPLTALEIALHSLDVVALAQGQRGMGLTDYARRVGLQPSNLRRYRDGARVYKAVQDELGAATTSDNFIRACRDRAEHLAAIHRAKPMYWVELVNWLVDCHATIDQTKDKVGAYLPAGEDDDRATGGDGASSTEAPGNPAPSTEVPPSTQKTEDRAAAPAPDEAVSEEVAPASEHANEPVTAPADAEAPAPTTSQETNGAIGAKFAVTGGATTADDGDDRLTAATQVFLARRDGVSQLRRIFPRVKDPVLRRALSAWDSRLGNGRQALPEETIQHLATQDDLARRLAEVERECENLVAAAPRGHRKLGETVTSVVRQLRDSGRDLLPAHVADADRRLEALRAKLANIRTPIEVAVATIARRS